MPSLRTSFTSIEIQRKYARCFSVCSFRLLSFVTVSVYDVRMVLQNQHISVESIRFSILDRIYQTSHARELFSLCPQSYTAARLCYVGELGARDEHIVLEYQPPTATYFLLAK